MVVSWGSVTLLVTLNEHAEKAEEKLQVLFGLRQREGVDGEVPRFLTNIEIRALEYRRKRLEAAADIEDESQRLVLLRVLQQTGIRSCFVMPVCGWKLDWVYSFRRPLRDCGSRLLY